MSNRQLLQRISTAGLLLLTGVVLVLHRPAADKGRNSAAPVRSADARNAASTAEDAALRQAYGRLPLSFEANQGQMNPAFHYRARGQGYSLYLGSSEALLLMRSKASSAAGRHSNSSVRRERSTADRTVSLRMRVVGGNPRARISGESELPGRTNYLLGSDPRLWRTDIRNFARVKSEDVYPGIDLIYYGNQKKLEYDFVIAPGASPADIRLAFEGSRGLSIDRRGDLVIGLEGGQVRQHRPIVYQQIQGRKELLAGHYVLVPGQEVGFRVGDYDRTRPLVIDPVLRYSTYVGGSDGDFGTGIAVDPNGNAYVTGWTVSFEQAEVRENPPEPLTDGPGTTAFPTVGPFQTDPDRWFVFPVNPAVAPFDFNSYEDAFVLKLNAAGNSLLYSTYYGGGGHDRGLAIAINPAGEAYITGQSGPPLPPFATGLPLVAPIQSRSGGGTDSFLLRLNAAGNFPIYSTYLGGSSTDVGRSIAVDVRGNTVIGGETDSVDFNTFQPFQRDNAGGIDAFVSNVNATGSDFNFSTYLGGVATDVAHGVAADSDGNVYLTGVTASTTGAGDFPQMFPIQPAGGAGDAFVTKLRANGSELIYSTFLGGSDEDSGRAIAVDPALNAYVTGFTFSDDFPRPNAFQPTRAGGQDAFLTKVNAAGNGLVYSTFLGGNGSDQGNGIAVGNSSNAYIIGTTSSTNFPLRNHIQAGRLGSTDVFITKYRPDASGFEYSTYLGGSNFGGSNSGHGIAVDGTGTAFISGWTGSLGFPVPLGAFQPFLRRPFYTGVRFPVEPPAVRDEYGPYTRIDVFVSRIANPPVAPSDLTVTRVSQTEVDLAWNDNSDNEQGFDIERKQGNGNFAIVGSVGVNAVTFTDTNLIPATTYTYRVRAFNAEGASPYSNQVTTTTLPAPPAAPDNLVVTPIDRTRLRLTWRDNSNNEEQFKIERRTTGASFLEVATVAADVTTYTDTGLTPNTLYFYRVRASNVGGDSAYSNEASARTLPDPPSVAPTNLTATAVSHTEIDLNWQYNIQDADGYKIYRQKPGDIFRLIRVTTDPNVRTFRDSGLTPLTTYSYKIAAYNVSGDGPQSAPASATTLPEPPATPTNLTATLVSSTQADLNWVDTSNNETGFRVERSVNGGPFALLAQVAANTTTYSDAGLAQDTLFTYRVQAVRNIGGIENRSGFSNTASVVTQPTAPTNLNATTVSQTQIDLDWVDTSARETSFKVEISTNGVDFSVAGTAPANATSFQATGLAEDTLYFFRVKATNAGGDSPPSNVASARTLPNPPTAPSGLTAMVISASQVNLSWVDTSNNEDGFRIERATNGGAFVPIGNAPANATAFQDMTTSADTAYDYRVFAFNAGGDSPPSNVASVVTPPTAPADLTAMTVSQTQIDLAWTDTSVRETGFKIEQSTDGVNFNQVGTAPANATSFQVTGLTADTLYFFRVKATNSGGDSPPSNTASARTLPNPPTAPANLTATVISASQINLNWTDTSNNEAGFRVERAVGNGAFATLGMVGQNVTTFQDTTTTADTTYRYRVFAFNAGGDSPPSNVVTVSTPPRAPTNLTAMTVSQTQIDLQWTDTSATETSFKIEISTDGVNFSPAGTAPANATTFSAMGLTADTLYFFRVKASNAGGDSPPSNVASARTLPNPPAAPQSLTATGVFSTRVDLQWVDASNNETGFRVERAFTGGAFSPVATLPAGTTTYSDTGLAPDTAYDYRVFAFNSGGDSQPSNVVSVRTLPLPPGAPTNLRAIVRAARKIDLMWNASAGAVDQYEIERQTDAGPFVQIATTQATTYTDTNVRANRLYTYRVRATNRGGSSPYSNTASARIPGGGRISVSPSRLDFPPTQRGQTALLTLRIRNTGNGTLMGFVGNLNDPFSIFTGGGYFTLEPGKSRRVQVQFTARPGSFLDRLVIESTDPNRSLVNVPVTGQGL